MQELFKKASDQYNDSFAGTRADILRSVGINSKSELVKYANMRFENLPERIQTLIDQNY
ncbi:hypothetical protein [Nitrosopumilus spindle-shaped virus]|uniref:Uncharacterized protein n=1 Tax=Nitrosopumilus spindle-shaped virus TaxID=2508184 RepID=A0A514K3A4_9VIRU|nr:hypothetical protein [Nitrosopumilus spindle-shaped virus]